MYVCACILVLPRAFFFFLLCLPSDNVQHELQRWPLKTLLNEEIPGNKGYLNLPGMHKLYYGGP